MAAVFKVDGLDLSVHLRVNQGDGLDPYDQNGFLDPQFAEGALSDGDPLLSIREGNREQAWTVILNPAKAGYTASKDGLHQLIRDVNRALRNAKVIEWRDDGATNSTYFDAQFARFDPAWDFRRSQKLWVQGTIKAWTKPYGHTGTSRLIGTSVSTIRPAPSAIVASGLDGDIAADVDVTVWYGAFTASYGASGKLFAGYSVIERASADIFLTAASVYVNAGAGGTHFGASGAVGSQVARAFISPSGVLSTFVGSGAEFQPPATGGLRLIALMRNNAATTFYCNAADFYSTATPVPLGATQALESGRSWRVVDLGVIRGERLVTILGRPANSAASCSVDFGGMLMLPEARTFAVNAPIPDPNNAAAATHVFGTATTTTARRSIGASGVANWPLVEMGAYIVGAGDARPAASAAELVQGFAIVDDGPQNASVGVEVKVREQFTYSR